MPRRPEPAARDVRERVAAPGGPESGPVSPGRPGLGSAAPGGASRVGAWRAAVRLATLPAAVSPVIVGLGVAIGRAELRPLPALGCIIVALLLQVAANLANDLFDFRAGADTKDRLGPLRAVASGLLSERDLVAGIVVVVGLAGITGLGLVVIGGPILLVLGLLAVVSAVAYTGGPWPYGYHGLGEVFVFVFFGLVAVAGTAYLQLGSWPTLGFVAAIPVGALVTGILVVNNLRDIGTDAAAGKRTLATRIGERATQAEYLLLLGAAYATPLALLLAGAATRIVILPLASLPIAFSLARVVFAGGDPRRLNVVLKGTARLTLVFSVLFALGLAAGGGAP